MRTLFARILLWFLATITITFVGVSIIAAIHAADPGRRPPMGRFMMSDLHDARQAWETGGREALAAFLSQLKTDFRAEAYFTDGAGRDLLTGQDRSALLRGRRPPLIPFFPRSRPPLARRTRDGLYWLILVFQDDSPARWVFLHEQLWILAAAVLLCYGFAHYLTSPLRTLQKTVERFGQGDFSARSGSSRRDELGDLARTFDQMAERIQTLHAAERRLLLDVSHELRSPLTRLGVAVELARAGENREAALNHIQKEADRLNELVGELLQVTRAEVDPASLRSEPVRLDELLGNVADDCSIEARTRGCELKLRTVPAVAEGDPELLRRAVENVIRNAIRYAPPDTSIDVALRRNRATAEICVRDYGPGVPEEALGRIFDPFYRVESDRNRTTGGVGLGLSIVRRAVELHKGTVRAKNANPGLEVEMDLPVSVA